MKKCRQLRIFVVVFAVLCSMALAVKGTHATPLQELFDGASITAGDKVFSDWILLDIEGNPDLTLIDVQPLPTPALNPGLLFLGNGQLVATPNNPLTTLDFLFTVTSLGQLIKDNSLELLDYELGGLAIVAVFEDVFDPAGNLIASKEVFAQSPIGPISMFDRADFSPLQQITVEKFIGAAVTDAPEDYAEIIAFEQRFSQVPEPATMLLLGTGLIGVAGAARRRKKK